MPIDHAIAHLDAASIDGAFAELVRAAARGTELSTEFLRDRLAQQGSAARIPLEDGVELAHLRVPRLETPYVLLGRADRRLDSANGHSADLIVLMLSPMRDVAGHLYRLARLTRLLRTHEFRAALRAAPTSQALCQIIGVENQESQAA